MRITNYPSLIRGIISGLLRFPTLGNVLVTCVDGVPDGCVCAKYIITFIGVPCSSLRSFIAYSVVGFVESMFILCRSTPRTFYCFKCAFCVPKFTELFIA